MTPPTGKSPLTLPEGYADWLAPAKGWDTKVIDRLALDLKDTFPDMRGWSSRNLKYMRFFCPALPGWSIWAAACCPIAEMTFR